MAGATAAGLGLSACGSPQLTLSGPAPGSHVAGNVVTLQVSASNVDSKDREVVYVDATPVAPGAQVLPSSGVAYAQSAQLLVSGLTVGRHDIDVVFEDSSGHRDGNALGSVSVTVEGPSVTAREEGELTAGTSFTIATSAFGVTIVDLSGDTSGHTAHYVALLDAPAPQAGKVPTGGSRRVETTGSLITIPGTTRGAHTVWVVLVDGAGKALSPLSAAEVFLDVPA